MPMAFKNSGLLFGAIGTVIVGFLCTLCVHMLVSYCEKYEIDFFRENLKNLTIIFACQPCVAPLFKLQMVTGTMKSLFDL